MKILQRYFFVNIAQAVAFVLVAFLALAAFMDLTGELPSAGRPLRSLASRARRE